MAGLRAAGCEVSLLAPAAGAALVGEGGGEVQRLIPWERSEVASVLFGGSLPAGPLREELAEFDAVIAYTRSAELPERLAGLASRVVAHPPTPVADAGHASAWLARPVEALDMLCPVQPPLLTASPEQRAASQVWRARLGAGFLAVHPGSGSAPKNWPTARYASLLRDLERDQPWLLVEGPADAEPAARLAADVSGAVRARELPLRVLGALLAEAGAFLGGDSGVTHLAAAFGAPTLALFGPTDPATWAPLGPRVQVLCSRTGAMDGISETEVRSRLHAMLVRPGADQL